MTDRVASNIGFNVSRKLPQLYSSKALPALDPTGALAALAAAGGHKDTGRLTRVAMGIAGNSGQVSVMHDNGAQINITLWIYSDVSQTWNKGGPVAGVYTQASDNMALTTFSVPPGALFFFQGSAAADNFYIGGSARYDGNFNADLVGA